MEGIPPRIRKEATEIVKDPVPGIKFTPDPANFRHYYIELAGKNILLPTGPPGSCYEGGLFKLELLLPDDYPMTPPKVIFDTKIYHPNIDILGRICLDILKKTWTPALQMKSVLLSVQCLLAEPNPDDPLNNQAAKEWKTNKKAAEKKAKEWTLKYAK